MREWITSLDPIFGVMVLAVLPVAELRGSIPYGIWFAKMPPAEVIIVSLIANTLVGPVAFSFLHLFLKALLKVGFIAAFWNWYIIPKQKRIHAAVERWGWFGLALFIGVPLPGTGVWSGAIGAYLLGMSFWRFMLAAVVGVLIAGAIVSIVVFTGTSAFKFLLAHP